MRILLLLSALCGLAQERSVDPTWLHRRLPDLKEQPADMTTPTCHYKPVFGEGDAGARIVRGVARYGELTVDPGGACAAVTRERQEEVYVILEGAATLNYGKEAHPVRKHDFLYLPAGAHHGLQNKSGQICRAIVMTFRLPRGVEPAPPPKLLIANIDDVPKQVVGNHPPSTLYQLLMGDTKSTRDKLAAAYVLTSLFIMNFTPGGTNFPHHHDREEEIYLLLEGEGEMVAGAGMDGVEGRHPARPGDAYFFRLNCTVGFYAGKKPARILAVRSLFPFPR